jgi:hypothetical protein
MTQMTTSAALETSRKSTETTKTPAMAESSVVSVSLSMVRYLCVRA